MSRSILARRGLLAVAALALVAVAAPLRAEAPAQVNAGADGLALRGYDPVAYFTLGKPTRGKADITATHEGATYRFVSTAHRDRFVADPAAYAPAYGGFCAFGTAMGYKVDADPDAWSIVDGRLYVNLNSGVQRRWQADPTGFIATADHNWPILQDLAPEAIQASQPAGLRLGTTN